MTQRIFVPVLLIVTCCTNAFCEKPRGSRLLGLGVTEGSVGYDKAFSEAKSLGMQFLELPQQWNEVEVQPGKFESPFLAIANQFYPTTNTGIVLSINPVDMSNLRVPAYLQGRRFDDAQFIMAFNRFVDYVLAESKDLKIVAISIGNEVDIWIGKDASKWDQYKTFANAVRRHIKSTHPNVPVGVKTTFSATFGKSRKAIARINANMDALMMTYYPLNDSYVVRPLKSIADDFGRMVKLAGKKPVLVLEAGYPSGSKNGGSLEKQAKFIDAVFRAWDQYPRQIKMINFVWLHDVSREETRAIAKTFPSVAGPLGSFFGTLGLKKHDGQPKPAFDRLKYNAKRRGWR